MIKDESTTDDTFRDGCCALIYLYLLAPLVSVEFLPPLPAAADTFGEIGTVVEKGLVTHEDLAKVSQALWAESGRGDVVPWNIPALSQFAPTISFAIKRSELEHTGRVIQRTKQGNTVRDYDLLQLKFWLPKVEPLSFDDEGDGTEVATDADAGESSDVEKDKDTGSEPEVADSDAEGTANPAEESVASKAAADVVGDDGPDLSAAERSYVFMVARTSPKLGLWSDQSNVPVPKAGKKGSAKAERAAAKARARRAEEIVHVCGRLFNGIPRGEAMDDEATRLDRDLPKDPNALAFSLRTEACGGEPWIFGHSGWTVYTFFVPVYLLMRKALGHYNAAVFKEEKDAGYAEEWALVKEAAVAAYDKLTGAKRKRSD